jgi:DNA recombination protein RmuC
MPEWFLGLAGVLFLVGLAMALALAFARIEAALRRLRDDQGDLHRLVQAGREASLLGLAQAEKSLQGQIGQAQRALAEVRALEQGRSRQLDYAADALRRLETIVAGSSARGAFGESLLAQSIGQLPPDLLARQVPFGSRVVEYSLRLPDGRYLPIDSKWTSSASLEELEIAEDPSERQRLRQQVARDLRVRIREMGRYLDPERTVSLAVLAVPDAVHAAASELRSEGWAEGVLVVPYSLALPFVLTVYRLAVRFAPAGAEEVGSRLHVVAESLARIEEEVEGRLSRGIVQVQNARDALRGQTSEAKSAAERLLRAPEVLS